MKNELTYSEIRKLEKHKEVREKLRFAVIIAIWFMAGIMIGRFIESFALGNLF
jgi:hypothetical protein